MKAKFAESVEAVGEPLCKVGARVFRHPVEGVRAILDIPAETTHGFLFLIWVTLTKLLVEKTPDSAPAKPLIVEVAQKIDGLFNSKRD